MLNGILFQINGVLPKKEYWRGGAVGEWKVNTILYKRTQMNKNR